MENKIIQYEKNLRDTFRRIDDIAFYNQKKVMNAFKKYNLSTRHFNGTTGYGYDDIGRDTLNKVYAEVFGAEKGIVTPLITCGTHALYLTLSALLRPNDKILSISGDLYDTLHENIFGIKGKDTGSLKDFNIGFEKIDLKNGDFDEDKILKRLSEFTPKIIYIQKSRGYAWRPAISIDKMKSIISKIREINHSSIIMVDNCYGEFVEKEEPANAGADVVVGSLIKNAGGGLVPTGAYIVGKKEVVELVENRLIAPSLGFEVGSFELGYRLFYQGLFMAPHTVKEAIKGAYLIGEVMKDKGYKISPESNEETYDIIKSIEFKNDDELIKFVQTIQKNSPIDSFVVPEPWDMPGYEDKVIMAAGTFVSGASIELSCDSPIRAPYIAYFQGGLTYEHIKCVAEDLINNF